MKSFENFKIKDLVLKNRIIMAPMCTYSSDEEGFVKNFHKVHYGSRAMGGSSLIIVEASAVSPEGRISNNDLGIWDDKHIEGLKSLVDIIHENGAKASIQLAHAGRKCDSGDQPILAPSPIRHSLQYKEPIGLEISQIKDLVLNFKNAAKRANEAGFDSIEIHGAHGYLIHQFLSPITNKRQDQYGGTLENRVRFLKEILLAINKIWPSNKPISLRLSASDYRKDGLSEDDTVNIVNQLKNYFQLAHISSGGLVSVAINTFPGYQVNLAQYIKDKCNIPTIAVGLITDYRQVEEILSNNRADLVALGRELLYNPYAPLQMAKENNIEIDFPVQYLRAFK